MSSQAHLPATINQPADRKTGAAAAQPATSGDSKFLGAIGVIIFFVLPYFGYHPITTALNYVQKYTGLSINQPVFKRDNEELAAFIAIQKQLKQKRWR